MRTILSYLLGLALSAFAAPPGRGYIDAKYPVESLNGKSIYILGLSKANAGVEGLVDRKGAAGVDSATSDSLIARFNRELSNWLARKLAKAVLKLDSGPVSAGFILDRGYGDSAVPDSIRMMVPSGEFFRKRGFPADVSLLIGRTVFGRRSFLVDKWTFPRQGPAFPHNGKNGLPQHFGGGFDGGVWPPFAKDDGEIDTSITKTKRKIFYSITEFCFFDHRNGKPFGYGIDVVETKFNGQLMGFLEGGKVDAGSHVSKMALSLVNLFVRADGPKFKKYRAKEMEAVEVEMEKDNTREELEPEEE